MAPAPSRVVEPAFVPPPKPAVFATCPKCHGRNVTDALLCQGMGSLLTNYGRWYQRCLQCTWWHWFGPSTPVDAIPSDVQVNHLLRRTSQLSQPVSPVSVICQQPGCPKRPCLANKLCKRNPPCCLSCCAAAGGCSIHRKIATNRTIREMAATTAPPLPATYPVPTPVLVSQAPSHLPVIQPSASMSSASVPSSVSTVVAPRTYARALNPSYAHGWINAHSERAANMEKIEVSQRAAESADNTTTVVLWTKKDEEPFILKVSNATPGSFRVCEHTPLVSRLSDYGNLVQVFDACSNQWVSHAFDLAVPVARNARVLLHAEHLMEEDCVRFNENRSLLSSKGKRTYDSRSPPPTPSKRARRSNSSHTPSPATPIVLFVPASTSSLTSEVMSSSSIVPINSPSTTSAPGQVTSTQLTFPCVYACQMVPMLKEISRLDKLPEIKAAFTRHFPGCLFAKSTVYKHRLTYKKARDMKLVDNYVKAGLTVDGRWNDLKEKVEATWIKGTVSSSDGHPSPESTPTLTPTPPTSTAHLSPEPSHIMVISDDAMMSEEVGVQGHSRTMKVEWFITEEGVISSYYTPQSSSTEVQILSEQPSCSGNKKSVWKFSAHVDGHAYITTFAAKSVIPKDPLWWQPWMNEDSAYFHEGLHLTTCSNLAMAFTSWAGEMDVVIQNFSFPDVFLFTQKDTSQRYIAQQWLEGNILSDLSTSSWGPTLEAFSHWTYSQTKSQAVCMNFQGIETGIGLYIYDCETHQGDSETQSFLGSDSSILFIWEIGHICNSICQGLFLEPLTGLHGFQY
ncbi:hypothetical protein QCA50_013453 [Cerrena zonata]|uniref:Alpha-type protein kinase domain-containing protein n=1 Tax=Cerrena zonata TaxID=2478898 RepID=A0AAW0FXJ5_9APHY